MDDSSRAILEDLGRIASDVGPALEPPGYVELLHSITEAARSQVEAAACSIARLDPTEEELVFLAASGGRRPEGLPAGS
jgi:hypothetical protein